MAQENSELHVVFVPYFTPSHMIPLVDIARLLASHGVKVSIITTHTIMPSFSKVLCRGSGNQIFIHKFKFSSDEVGLPEGIENFSAVTSKEMAMFQMWVLHGPWT